MKYDDKTPKGKQQQRGSIQRAQKESLKIHG